MLEETTIQISDLDELRSVLAACLNYFSARDLEQAQLEFRATRPSPLTAEIERVKTRFDSYFSDFLLRRHEELLETEEDEDDLDVEEDVEEAEHGSQSLSEAPLGTPVIKRQKGRVLEQDEI